MFIFYHKFIVQAMYEIFAYFHVYTYIHSKLGNLQELCKVILYCESSIVPQEIMTSFVQWNTEDVYFNSFKNHTLITHVFIW